MQPAVEDVFKVSGVPTFTFVVPSDFNALKVALRSRGRGVVVEGPSGIGKSTAVESALATLNLDRRSTKLSARDQSDVDLISLLPRTRDFGFVIVDDFHRLPDHLRRELADLAAWVGPAA